MHTHSGSRRRVEAAVALRTALLSLTTHVSDRLNLMYYLGHMLKQIISVTSATSFYPDALQIVHLVFFPLQREPIIQ